MAERTDPAAVRLIRRLRALGRRAEGLAAARGAAVGVAVASVLLLLGLLQTGLAPWVVAPGAPAAGVVVLLALIAGGWLGRWRHRRRIGAGTPGAARLVEALDPSSRNLVRTAEEVARRGAPPGPVNGAVLEDAAHFVEALEPARLLPAHRAAVGLAGALALGTIAILVLPGASDGTPLLAPVGSAAGAPGVRGTTGAGLHVTVVPPAWIGGPETRHQDPERLHVLAGSRLHLEVRPTGSMRPAEVVVETVEGVFPLRAVEGGAFRTTLPADADGFLAIEGRGADGAALFRGMSGLTVFPDQEPRLRIVEPGRDLYLPDGDRELDLVIEATDDHALADLELVFTRVSGFGELFIFEEGEIPLEIERHGPRSWTARAKWDLSTLALDRGESVVYHARARDRRPGAPPAASETWLVEVLGGDAALSGGFAGEDELTRYALSQQMILEFTRRLRAGADTLSPDDLLRESMTLAAGQRRVRAEFVFMLGGELEDDAHLHGDDPFAADDHDHDHDQDPVFTDPDAPQDLHEEAHARADQDAAEGRLAQQGRQELSRAVQAMSRAAAFLNVAELGAAIEAEELALAHLQRAFSSSRYILRAMTEREELDLERRLTGSTAGAVPDLRAGVMPDPDPAEVELRAVLAEVAGRAARPPSRGPFPGPVRRDATDAQHPQHTPQTPADEARALLALATRVLALRPGDPAHQEVAAHLRAAADALEGPAADRAGVQPPLQAAAAGVAELLRARLAPAPATGAPAPLRRLDGLLARELADLPVAAPPGGEP